MGLAIISPSIRGNAARAGATARNAALALFVACGLSAAPVAAQLVWTKSSPGGGGAFLTVDVSVDGKVLVGSDLSGVYRRSGTGSWTRLGMPDGLDRTFIAAVKWHPTSPDTALAGGKNGLFISGNSGVSWQRVSGPALFQENFFSALGWSRSNPSRIFAAGSWSSSDTTVLLWRSSNGGFNWSPVAHDLPATEVLRVLKIVVDPASPEILYMVTGNDDLTTPKVRAPKKALYKSTDGGSTWALKSGADSTLDVAVHPDAPNTLLMTVTTGNDVLGSLLRSEDGGDTWSPTHDDTGGVFTNTGAVWWDPPKAYLINVGLDACQPIPANAGRFVSADGGITWTRESTGINWKHGWTDCRHARGRGAAGVANTLSARGEYWVTSQFVWYEDNGKYEDGFTTEVGSNRWITTGIDNAVPVCFADARSAMTAYAGYYDLGLWRTQDGGQSWGMINPVLPEWDGVGGNVTSVVADSTRPGVVWATIAKSSKPPYQYQLFKSTNWGATWSQTATGLPFPTFLTGLSLDHQSPSSNRKLWVTANGRPYVSTNDGQTWQPAPTAGGLPTTGLYATHVDRRNGNRVFVGGWSGLWRSGDGGATWAKLSNGFDYTSAPGELDNIHRFKWHGPHQILSDPFVPGKVWVTSYVRDTTEMLTLHRGLYVSTNDGDSWLEVRRGSFYRGIALDSLGRKAYVTSSPATTSGSNNKEIEASKGLEIGRSSDGLAWTWIREPFQADIRYPFAWTVSVGDGGQVWVGIPGYGFMKLHNRPPVAMPDSFLVYTGTQGNLLDVLANDFDPDSGDKLSLVSLDLTGTLGTATIVSRWVDYVPPPGFAGVDSFRYVMRDQHGATSSAKVKLTVQALPVFDFEVQITSGSDDAEEQASGSMGLTSSDLELTFDTSDQTIGLRFDQVAVPQGSLIANAYVQFTVDETSSEPTSLTFEGHATDHAPAFNSTAWNISSRTRTAAAVPWSPVPWPTTGAQGPDQRSPDLSPLIAEIVGRPGWQSGNSLVIIITGTGRRVAESANGDPAGAPILHITYGSPTPVGVDERPAVELALHAVGPAPTRAGLRVEFSLADAQPATLDLFDIAGRRVATRAVGDLGPGRHRIDLREPRTAGVYLLRLRQGSGVRVKKAVVLD